MRTFLIFYILMSLTSRAMSQIKDCLDTTDLFRESRYLSYETHDLNQHSFSIGIADDCKTSRYVAEFKYFSIATILRDPYNNDRFNVSFPVIPLVVTTGLISHHLENFGPDNILLLLLGSQHHWYLWDEPRAAHRQRPQWISLFYKHNVEWYAFRIHQWIDLSPAVGICLHFLDTHALIFDDRARLSIELAFSRDIATDFKAPRYSDVFFVSLRIFGPPF